MPTLNELLAPQVLFKSVVSRIRRVGDPLQRFWGLELGNGNVEDIPGMVGAYDIFDNVRTAASIRARNTGPSRIAVNPISQVPVTCARFYEAMPLYYDRIFPLRRLGGPASEVDEGGADYIRRQQEILRMRFANAREWLVAGMMRGSCQVLNSGEDWLPVFTGGTTTISWQIPTGNTGSLNLTGAGAIISTLWSDTINSDIFGNLMSIDAGFWAIHGWPLKHIWLNGVNWSNVTNNAGLKARSGSANVVFEMWNGLGQDVNPKDYNAKTPDEMTAVIRCLPGITWHIYNGGLNLGTSGAASFTAGTGGQGTFTKFFPDTGQGSAVFTPEPSDLVTTSVRGSEYIQENEVQPAVERRGPYFYPMYRREPAVCEIVGWDAWFPALKVPKCIGAGTIA